MGEVLHLQPVLFLCYVIDTIRRGEACAELSNDFA